MNLLATYVDEIRLRMIKDCENFLTNCSDLQASSKFLTNTMNYFKVFMKSFVKKLTTQETQEFLNTQL